MKRRWIVLFDWDGTLVNSLDIKIANASSLFAQFFGVPQKRVEAAYRQHSGIPRPRLFDAICSDNGLPGLSDDQYEHLSQRFSEMNHRSLLNTQAIQLVSQEVWEALRSLHASGYPLYVSSSAEAGEIREIAHAFGLDSFFQEIMGSSQDFSKGTQHVDHVLQVQAADRSEVVFVGDEPADVALGRAAQVITIVKTGTYSAERLAEEKPDFIVRSLSELPALLERSLSKTGQTGEL